MDPSLTPDSMPPSHGWEVMTGEVIDLVERSQAGDERAFADLMRRYYAPLLKFVRVRVTPPIDGEDVAMETFVTLFRRISSLSDPRRFVTFLFGIARNLCNHQLFVQRHRSVEEIPWQDWSDPEAEEAIPPALIGSGADEAFWRRETRREIVGAISRLPAPEREPLLLRYQEEFSYDQIAQILGVPMEMARYRVRRARRRLATLLPPDED
jgi:RNA polymerase sigma-70 factor (ECF subfamily)